MTSFEAMTGHVAILMRPIGKDTRGEPMTRTTWAKAIAWAIAARRTRFSSQSAYLSLAAKLEKSAKARIRRSLADRARMPQSRPTGLPEPLDLPAPIEPAYYAQIRRRVQMSEAPISARSRVSGLRAPLPEPVPIRAILIKHAKAATAYDVPVNITTARQSVTDSQTPTERASAADLVRLRISINARRTR